MPQNTPMKRQFTTIDGRTVMSNLPQHWGGNDWKITGVDNPLPVGNYVQTEAGVWIPQKGSDDGAADVRLTGSYVEYDVSNNFGTIPAGTNKHVVINVPDGVTKFVLAARVTGIVSEVRYGTLIGGFIPNLTFYKRITGNEVFLIAPSGASDGRNWANLVTKKLDLLSNGIIISITASEEGDVSPNTQNDAGIKVYFWRE